MQNTFAPMTQTQVQIRVNAFVRGVYNWMALGLALTGLTAYFVVNSPSLYAFVRQAFIIFAIAELALVFTLSARIEKLQASTATGIFLIYAVLNGATLSILLKIYTNSTIAVAFFVCAASFLAQAFMGGAQKRTSAV